MNRFDGEVLAEAGAMTPEDWAHVDRVDAAQSKMLRDKYPRGKSEHFGSCWLKPGMLSHAIEEHSDQGVYLHTLAEQMIKLADRLREGFITKEEAANEIERWLRK